MKRVKWFKVTKYHKGIDGVSYEVSVLELLSQMLKVKETKQFALISKEQWEEMENTIKYLIERNDELQKESNDDKVPTTL